MPSPKRSWAPSRPLAHNPHLPSSNSHQAYSHIITNSVESDDEEYAEWGMSSKRASSPPDDDDEYTTLWEELMHDGGLGKWLFQTRIGWLIYVGSLGLWVIVGGTCLVLVNRLVLWSGYLYTDRTSHTQLFTMAAGVHDFPYPLTLLFVELVGTHTFLLTSAITTRLFGSWLTSAGLAAAVAPAYPFQSSSAQGSGRVGRLIGVVAGCLGLGSGGIAGGGIFEFELSIVRRVLPLSAVYVMKLLLTTHLFSTARLADYFKSRLGILPIALVLTTVLNSQRHSGPALVSAMMATFGLCCACYRTNTQLSWSTILLGVLSSSFVTFYPLQIQRTYHNVLESILSHGHLPGTLDRNNNKTGDASGTPEERRAYWRLLHYTSILSIIISSPILLLSGEPQHIWRNPSVLAIHFPWFSVLCGGIASWAVFLGTMALTRATGALTVAFVLVPQASFLLCLTTNFRLATGTWAGLWLCWVSCIWFVVAKARQAKRDC